MNLIRKIAGLPLLGWILRHRFIKFGTVGATGVFVNLGVLYFSQEHLLTVVQSPETRLNASLAIAIFFSTINNFTWNRIWTWADRKHHHCDKHLLIQFGQYALACWFGILLQVIFTKTLTAAHFHYLIANLIAIVLASIFNFMVNDFWTFGRSKRLTASERHPIISDNDKTAEKIRIK
ncbi:MAG: GtrA family protein [Sulfuricella sp.]|nr:GtrA family protein [Sulfuricella sp.]